MNAPDDVDVAVPERERTSNAVTRDDCWSNSWAFTVAATVARLACATRHPAIGLRFREACVYDKEDRIPLTKDCTSTRLGQTEVGTSGDNRLDPSAGGNVQRVSDSDCADVARKDVSPSGIGSGVRMIQYFIKPRRHEPECNEAR